MEQAVILKLIKWTLIGLLIRLLIMPFSFHGSDIFWINYFPFQFIEGKLFDPYLYISENVTDAYSSYYLPVTFYLFLFFQFLFKPFLPKLNGLYSIFASWHFKWEGNTINYADILIDQQLFRTLFFSKIPYLICDFVIGFILFQILKEDKKKFFIALLVWVLNPFVLHSIYALGQLDIIIAMFIILSLLAVKSDKPYFSIFCLSLGAGLKIVPLILIPALLIILGKSWRERFKLAVFAAAIFLLPLLPFFLSSKFAVFKLFGLHEIIMPMRRNIFIIGYTFLLVILYFLKRQNLDPFRAALFSFVSILLFYYAVYDVRLRFFVWITPLLIIAASQNKIFWLYNIIFFITLFELRAAGSTQQWGFFAALHPEFFSSLPVMDSYLNLIINVKYIHQVMYRLFIFFSLTMIMHLFIDNRDLFRFSFANLRKR